MNDESAAGWTGSGTDTGAGARRGHDNMRRSHRQTHPGDGTAYRMTSARARHIGFSLADASAERRARNSSTFSGAAREPEDRHAAPAAYSRT